MTLGVEQKDETLEGMIYFWGVDGGKGMVQTSGDRNGRNLYKY
jgi:hypothetical protein